ncbi:unnamed protein product [Trypanosoma congolense IL3000]|uniref:WGS project CAEQ00000000 data, annotated contig 594 n=1 Tax=Trypanosoma congolense (strain IL3000) TaxID=1068625 RepID=F9WH50_TRYCI|nr:unnamed protein product [Trypanosoma congolense IL3000]
MTTAQGVSVPQETTRRAASGSPFPQLLPPRYPASSSKNSAAGVGPLDHGAASLAPNDVGVVSCLQHPLITAADYSDRRQLLSHITVLSGQLQRAEIMLRNTPYSVVSEADLARFDPLVAQSVVDRLDSALAQLSLLHEMERQRSGALEEEREKLRDERNRLVARVDELEIRGTELEVENTKLRNKLEIAQEELEVLRGEESALSNRLRAIEQLQLDGSPYDGIHVIVAPPRSTCSAAAKELQLQEAVQRLSLLSDMMMEPIHNAFEAGVLWMTEAKHQQEAIGVGGAVAVEGPYDSEVLTTLGGNSPLGNASDVTLPQEAAIRSSSVVTSCNGRSTQHQPGENIYLELITVERKWRASEKAQERLQALLLKEQQRTEAMAKEHVEQLQRVHDQMVYERRQVMESLVAEVEEKMRNAFRDGRLYQKKLEKLSHRRMPSAAQSRSGHSSARSGSYAAQRAALTGDGTQKEGYNESSSFSLCSPMPDR